MVIASSLGKCTTQNAHIYLEKSLDLQVKEQTFCHELVHSILFMMGYIDHDEVFVDNFSSYLYQYLTQHGK
jgi:ssRNA-specific RNase YbeY (16S rRNA maturation enzyme)